MMKKVQHEIVNIMQYQNIVASNSATSNANTLKIGTSLA